MTRRIITKLIIIITDYAHATHDGNKIVITTFDPKIRRLKDLAVIIRTIKSICIQLYI